MGAHAVGHGPLAGRHFPGIAARGRPAGRRGAHRPRRQRRLPDPRTLGTRIRLPGGGDHVPVLAAVDADPHRRDPVSRRAVDGDRTLALHAVLQDLRHGGPAVLEGHRPGDGPRGPVHDADRPAEPGHVPAGQRPGQARRDPAVLHLERRRAEVALARRGRAGGAHAALAGADLPRRRHRQPHRGPADHGLVGGRPQLHGRLQGQPAGALPLPAAALHPLQAGRAARPNSAGSSSPATTSPSPPAGPRAPSPPA